jgi:hypothetical protein
MKIVSPIVLGLALLLGLVAWRIGARHAPALPGPSEALRPANPARASTPVPSRSPESLVFGHVGSQVITRKRLALWKSIGALRSGEPSSPDEEALVLLEQALKREIAERIFGIHPSAADLGTTLGKLASDPKDAATLERIEAVFEGDHRAFLEEFVGPAFIESELWSRFSNDPEIHRASRDSAEDLASKARKDPRHFATLGSPGDGFGRGLIELSPHDAAPTPKGNPLPRLGALPVDLAALARMPAGQLYPSLIATPEAFVVLFIDRQRPGFAEVETWTVAKVPYLPWLTDRARELDRRIDSPELKATLEALDPGHWLHQVFR